MRRCCVFAVFPLVLALAIVARTGAQAMPKLPDGLAIQKSADSPGQVTFNHVTHVDAARPDCTVCHPKPFSMLKTSKAANRITHARMEKGEQCGRCHDGKKAFGLEEDCTFCHKAT